MKAYSGCRFCYGRGCIACDGEREKAEAKMPEPIFVAKRDDPEDMAALKRVFGAEALKAAFSEGGGGMQEIDLNAAIESLRQALRKEHEENEVPVASLASDAGEECNDD